MNSILLVEDEQPLLEKLKNNIEWEEHGYRIFTASNGKEALKSLREDEIDILVTDIKMPGISGIELIKKSRELGYEVIPIIISGYAEFEYARESIRLNVVDYLLKPFRSYRLLEIVEKARKNMEEKQHLNQELQLLKEEMGRNIQDNPALDLLLNMDEIDVYKKQEVVLKHENLFQNLKAGSRKDILADIEDLFTDIEELAIKENTVVIINSVILLALKLLKDLDFKHEDFIRQLEIKQEIVEKGDMRRFLTEFLLQVNHFIKTGNRSVNKRLISKVKSVVEEELTSGITLGDLASRFNVSNSHLSRLFHRHTGKKFSHYLDDIRLIRARELLKTTDNKIYQIADEVGFDDPYYFSSWFKKKTGLSPTTYRNNIFMLE